ncbi:MAG: DUF945 family protein [Pseudomonadota bacterium]
MNLTRILLIASLPVAAIIAVPPALIGPEVEEQMQIALAEATDNPVASVRLAEYDRGWFGATGRIVVQAREDYIDAVLAERAAAAAATQDPQAVAAFADVRSSLLQPVELDLDVAHGTLLFQNGLALGAASAVATLQDSAFKEKLPDLEMNEQVSASMRIGFDQSVAFDVDVPAFRFPIEEEGEAGEVQFLGFELAGLLDTVSGEVDYEGTMPSFAVTVGDASIVSVDETRVEGHNTQLTEDVWIGDSAWTTQQVRVFVADTGEGDAVDFNLDGFTFTANLEVDDGGELLLIEGTYAVDKMTAEGYEGSLHLPVSLSNIPVESMQQYMTLVSDPANAAAMNDDDTPLTAELTEQLFAIFEPVLAASPALRIGPAKVDLPEGPVNVDMQVQVAGDEFSQAGLAAMADPNVLGKVLSANLDASLPVAQAESIAEWVLADQITSSMEGQPPEYQLTPEQASEMAAQQVPGMLSELVQQGIIKRDGDSYVASIKVKDGNIDMNGLVLPLAMFAQ